MYSRFVTWQMKPYLDAYSELGDENKFCVTDQAVDIRFNLKGYGFKRNGESNRQIYHFGCYQCFYRKLGEESWKLFAHAQSEREGSESANVYKDIAVTCGKLPEGIYEIKILACKLVEFGAWAGGVVEGIVSNGIFYYNLAARINIPHRVRGVDDVTMQEFSYAGMNPINIFGGTTFDEIIQAIDLPIIEVEMALEPSDEVSVADDVALSVV
jgi:hypothetical protein